MDKISQKHWRKRLIFLVFYFFLGAGGAKRPAAQVGVEKKVLPLTDIATGYGMTETNALGIGIAGDEYLDNPEMAGRLYPPIQEIKIVPEILKFLFSSKGFTISSKYIILIFICILMIFYMNTNIEDILLSYYLI